MSFLNKFKSIAANLFAVYAINNFTLPIGYAFYQIPKTLDNPKIQEVMGTRSYGEKFEEGSALDFLKLAHAITSKNIRYCNDQWPTDNENLENGVGDCYQIARFTYSNYLYLIDQHNRTNLDSEVRLVLGEVFTPSDGGGHCWVEIKDENGNWVEYETTNIDLPKMIKINPQSIDSLILDGDVLDLEKLSYNRVMNFQRNGKDISTRVDIIGALKSRGLIYHIYSSIKHQI